MSYAERYLEFYINKKMYINMCQSQEDEKSIQYTRTEKFILYILYTRGTMSMGELSTTFNLPNSTTNFIINKLKKNKLVLTEKCQEDRRIVEAKLTDMGRKFTESIIEHIDERLHTLLNMFVDHLKEKMDPKEIQTVEKAIGIICG